MLCSRRCDSSVLLGVQETFDAGLQAFQQEGITNITALKEQLLEAQHVQSRAIEARHASLIKRWNQLLSNSAARKKKLLEAQEHFRKVGAGLGTPRGGPRLLRTSRLMVSCPSRWRTCS